MNKNTLPPLLLTKLSVIILVAIFFTGIVEIACLALYAHKTNYSILNETVKSFNKPVNTLRNSPKSSMLILPSK